MAQRSAHIITASHADEQPKRLVALAIDAERISPAVDPYVEHERMTMWSSCGWSTERDGSRRRWACESTDVERWWRALLWSAKRGGITWIVAHRAVRVLSLLGAWTRIERGEVQWDGEERERRAEYRRDDQVHGMHSYTTGDGPSGRRHHVHGVPGVPGGVAGVGCPATLRASARNHCVGYIAIGDPPTVITLRVSGLPGRLRICDVRNWGIDDGPWDSAPGAVAAWIRDAMTRMIDQLATRTWGGLAATAGSQAMRTWRRAFLHHDVEAHCNETALELESEAYVGGRCECARIGRAPGPVYVVDVRSMYPYVCATMCVPVAVKAQGVGQVSLLRSSDHEGLDSIATAQLDTEEADYPDTLSRPAIWPIGRYITTLAGPELHDALAAGRVHRIGQWTVYHMEPALREYALALYEARCEFERSGDAALKQWIKLMLVALPGKLGQRDSRWVRADDVRARAKWMTWWESHHEGGVSRLRSLAGSVQREVRSGWSNDAVPAMACCILSAARMHLLRGMRIAGRENVYYWDTDSLFLSEAGYANLCGVAGMCGTDLGQWSLRAGPAECTVAGIKHYTLDGRRVCAGMPSAESAQAAMIDHYWYRTTFGQALIGGFAPSAVRRLARYARTDRYTLGKVGADGRVYPYVREDW
jgi:hypothetical protein